MLTQILWHSTQKSETFISNLYDIRIRINKKLQCSIFFFGGGGGWGESSNIHFSRHFLSKYLQRN